MDAKRISDVVWELPTSFKKGMNVPVRIYANENLMKGMEQTVLTQASNVASLPGLVGNVFVLPDGHQGYGSPVGAAFASDTKDGIVSPGAIGFDVNCSMRLMRTNLTEKEVKPRIKELVDLLFKKVPTGVGSEGAIKLNIGQMHDVLTSGMKWCLDNDYAWKSDLENAEENGCMEGADPENVSERAMSRGKEQMGSLGSGNHYLEIQIVDKDSIKDEKLAKAFGIFPGQVLIMGHCGSRGLGHQIATDYIKLFLDKMSKYKISVPDRELACGPFNSEEGQAYFSAMKCGVNFALANKQIIFHKVREVFSEIFKKSPEELGMEMLYDVAHNIGKIEKHKIDGKMRNLLVHRKGATRSFGPSYEDHPLFKKTGQPVIIGGSMETGSYLLVGTDDSEQTFATTAHGSGRTMSRVKAKAEFSGKDLQKKMEARGIFVKSASYSGLAEEAGAAYKDIHEVVDTCIKAGLNKAVVALRPIGNIKG